METHLLTKDVHQVLVDFIDRGTHVALVTVLESTGSTPRKRGTKAIVDSAGSIWATIGGGALEAQAAQLAAEAVRTTQPVVFDFKFAGTSAADCYPVCGGSMRILIDPTVTLSRAEYTAAVDAHLRRQRGVLITTVRGTKPSQVVVQWFTVDEIPRAPAFPSEQQIETALTTAEPKHFVEDPSRTTFPVEALVEPVVPLPQLVIVGGGHVGQALALQASQVGFEIVLIEDRAEFAHPDRFPAGATIRCGDVVAVLNDLSTDPDTYIALASRGHVHDAEALAACIRKPAAYLGMLGSRRKVVLMRQLFIDSGRASEEELDRVHAPIGLDLGAETVPEIAASIVAELIAVRRTGRSLRDRDRSSPR